MTDLVSTLTNMARPLLRAQQASGVDKKAIEQAIAAVAPIIAADCRCDRFIHGAFSSAGAAVASGMTRCWARGSSASCSPSPRKLQAITVMKISRPG